jgi:hypothetical protein
LTDTQSLVLFLEFWDVIPCEPIGLVAIV